MGCGASTKEARPIPVVSVSEASIPVLGDEALLNLLTHVETRCFVFRMWASGCGRAHVLFGICRVG